MTGEKLTPFQNELWEAAQQWVIEAFAEGKRFEKAQFTYKEEQEARAKFELLLERVVDIDQVKSVVDKTSQMIAQGIADYANKQNGWIK